MNELHVAERRDAGDRREVVRQGKKTDYNQSNQWQLLTINRNLTI